MEPYIGQVLLVGWNFAANGFAFCNGQQMAIAQNTALYSLLANTFGGDGVNTFNLPDLRGRAPIGFGHGDGLSNRPLGQASGFELTTLIDSNMPAHNHAVMPSQAVETVATETGDGRITGSGNTYVTSVAATSGPLQTGMTGGGQPFNNMQPYLAMNYQIALVGIYPSRS